MKKKEKFHMGFHCIDLVQKKFFNFSSMYKQMQKNTMLISTKREQTETDEENFSMKAKHIDGHMANK